jgi:hypothetical protein
MNEAKNIDSISTFFNISHYQYRIFDMGHKVYQLSNQRFKRIEEQKETYPTPFKQEAWLGILFWRAITKSEPIIWFIHLPIDELGLLKLETRDLFIQQTLEQVGEKIIQAQTKKSLALQKQHDSSSFAFKPNQEKMAIFNAFAKKTLNQKPSQYYLHTLNYLEEKTGYEQWSFLGIQGIADVVARLDNEKETHNNLINAIPHLPSPPLIAFSTMMEHIQISIQLSTALLTRLKTEINTGKPNIALQAALIRALSSSQSSKHRKNAINIIMQQEEVQNIEILAAIASRSWETLLEKKLLKRFLEVLATQPQEHFDNLQLSLMTIPTMQIIVQKELKNSEVSAKLGKKIEGFMKRFISN